MISEERISEILGTSRTPTSKRARTSVPLREQVRAGLRFSTLEAFQRRYRLSPEQLRVLIDISERTISRRRQEQRLTKSESDRLYRVARVAALAEDMFGSPAAAENW